MIQIKKQFILISLVILLLILAFTQLNFFNNNSNLTTTPDSIKNTASKSPTSAPTKDKSKTKNKPQKNQNQPKTNQTNLNLDDYVKKLIKSTLGKNNKKTLLKYQYFENKLNLHLSAKINENFTAKMAKKEILLNSKRIISNFFNDNQKIPTLILTWYLNLVDKKDGEIGEKILLIQISKENFETLNWKEVSAKDLPEIVDKYWIEPALK